MKHIITFLFLLLSFKVLWADEYDFDSMFEANKNRKTQKKTSIEVKTYLKNSTKNKLDMMKKERVRKEKLKRETTPFVLKFVLVSVECISGGTCFTSNLKISGGAGNFEPGYNGANQGGIHRGYDNALAGQYNWKAKVDNTYCSGRFNLSGTKQTYSIRVYPDCRDAGSSEY